jgi:hypothetical protein
MKFGRSAGVPGPKARRGDRTTRRLRTVAASIGGLVAVAGGHSERSSRVIAEKRYPTGRPVVERPGFLNRDWRSGFADSNP